MVENIFRELGAIREGQDYNLEDVILNAAKDVDRPIFYSVAVIIAGYLPIYAPSGPSGKNYQADGGHGCNRTGRRIDSDLTLAWVMCAFWFRKGVHDLQQALLNGLLRKYAVWLDCASDNPKTTIIVSTAIRRHADSGSLHRRGIHAASRWKCALWVSRHHAPHGVSFDTGEQVFRRCAIFSQYPMVTDVGSGARTSRRWHRPHGFLQR